MVNFFNLIKIAIIIILTRFYRFYIEFQGSITKVGGAEKVTILKNSHNPIKAVCIFYGYQNKLNTSFEKQLEDICQNGFYIVYVTNMKLSDEMKGFIAPYCSLLIERPNYGRDIGGYKSGFQYIQKAEFESATELLFMNDTILYPIFDSVDFWIKLRALEADIVGPYSSYQLGFHLQSFLLLCKNSVHKHPNFIKYWNEYKCPNSRQNVIAKGEIGFSSHMLNYGFTLDSLINPLNMSEMIGLNAINKSFIPKSYIKNFKGKLGFLLNAYQRGNPSHMFCLIGPKYYSIPLLKKDLVSRGTVSIIEILVKINGLNTHIPTIELQKELLVKWQNTAIKSYKKRFLERIGEL